MVEQIMYRDANVGYCMSLRYWVYRLRGYDHTKAYAEAANTRYAAEVKENLNDEKGGGELQLEFLQDKGLKPSDRLLDLGCGYLRAGQYFIDYLEPGHYVGMDISARGFEAARSELDDHLFTANWPQLMTNTDLKFNEFEADTFDYILAQSVFSHLKKDDIEECAANIGRVLKADGVFFATYFDKEDGVEESSTQFTYDKKDLQSIIQQYNLSVSFLSKNEYPHPGGQRMMEVRPR